MESQGELKHLSNWGRGEKTTSQHTPGGPQWVAQQNYQVGSRDTQYGLQPPHLSSAPTARPGFITRVPTVRTYLRLDKMRWFGRKTQTKSPGPIFGKPLTESPSPPADRYDPDGPLISSGTYSNIKEPSVTLCFPWSIERCKWNGIDYCLLGNICYIISDNRSYIIVLIIDNIWNNSKVSWNKSPARM